MTEKPKDDIEVIVSEETDLALPLDVDILDKEDKNAPPVAKAAEKPAAEDDPIASLQRQLDEAKAEADRERRARADAERQARDNAERATSATNGTIAAHLDAVESAMSQTKLRADNAQKAYAAAMEVADYDAAAKAQREMSEAQIDMRSLEGGKRELQQRQRQAKEAPTPSRQERSGLDGYIDGILENSSSKAQDYIRKNRSALKSEKDVNRMIAAHNLAVNSDIEPDTDAYFAAIDKQMGWSQPEVERQPAPKPQTKTVAAPVSRDGAPGTGSPTRVTLSPAQVAIAKELGITPAAYAKNLMKLKANGRDPNADGLRLSADIRN